MKSPDVDSEYITFESLRKMIGISDINLFVVYLKEIYKDLSTRNNSTDKKGIAKNTIENPQNHTEASQVAITACFVSKNNPHPVNGLLPSIIGSHKNCLIKQYPAIPQQPIVAIEAAIHCPFWYDTSLTGTL